MKRLMHIDFTPEILETKVDQLLKLIFFESDAFEEVEVKDILEVFEKRQTG
jgi:hypothetical protein